MIMSEKIMSLRKKMGWSQEELANELNVSRQSVSKWETGVSIPDMAKIVMMSEVFGVTTDYLLKEGANDEILELNSSSQEITSSDIKKDYKKEGKTFVTIEEADAYLDLEKKNSLEVGFGVALCIWSSIILIILESISESKPNVLRESLASAIGVSIMFIMIAIAVYIFFTRASRAEKFSYIEKEVLELAYGVEASIKRKKEAYSHIGDMNIALGVVAIILELYQ
ncbi:MAG: helix-turn-helix domain-containing protein [Peptostreptococcus anaerobius]